MSARHTAWWRVAQCTNQDAIVVRVRVTPKSSLDAIEGIELTAEGPAFKARVRAIPSDGAANAAVQRLVAEWLGVSKTQVSLVAGAKSRVKSFAVTGQPSELEVLLSAKSARVAD